MERPRESHDPGSSRSTSALGDSPSGDHVRRHDGSRDIAALSAREPDDLPPTRPVLSEREQLQRSDDALRDVSEKLARTERELRSARHELESERERFTELFEIASEGHIVTDPSGTILEVNRRAAAMLNVPVEFLIGKPLPVFVDAAEKARFRTRVYRAHHHAAEEGFTTTLVPREGEPTSTYVAVSPLMNERSVVTSLRWRIRDTSRSRANEIWDRTPAAILRAAIDALAAHVAVVDAEGNIVTVNRAWRDASLAGGLFEGAAPGANYLERCLRASAQGRAGAEVARTAVEAVLKGQRSRTDALYSDAIGESSAADANDTDLWFALRVTRCDGPSPLMAVITHDDVTAERRSYTRERTLLMERTKRMAAEGANRAKNEFLATLSHELRTPLNAIAGYAQLLEMGVRGPVTLEQAEDLRRILRSEQHLLGLINELLNFGRLERGDVALTVMPVSLPNATREVLELVEPHATKKSLALTHECSSEDLAALADRDKLRQILVNLLSNAVKFTPDHGTIDVSCIGDGAAVRICVRDTGIGIPLDKQATVFDPFVQVNRGSGSPSEGIGLGLAISRGLARALGGDLTLRSEPGKGSTFELTLPRAGSTVASRADSLSAPNAAS